MYVHIDLAGHAETDLWIGTQECTRILRVTEFHDPVGITSNAFFSKRRLYVVDVKHAHPRLRDLLLHARKSSIEVLVGGDGVIEFHTCILAGARVPCNHGAHVQWSNGCALDTMSSMMGYGFGFAPFGFIFMILWWVLIIAGIVALVKWISRNSGTVGASHRSTS